MKLNLLLVYITVTINIACQPKQQVTESISTIDSTLQANATSVLVIFLTILKIYT